MKTTFVVSILSAAFALAQPQSLGNFRMTTERISLRDGQSLAADVYVPKSAAGKLPTVLIQTPYDRTLMRAMFRGEGRYGADSLFTDTNFTFVIVDQRGRHASKDALVAGKPQNLSQDGFDTVAWVAKQTWSDGKVGTWGASALGRAQYETARSNPPALVCSVPMVMPLNLDYDTYFPGGAAWQEFLNVLTRLGFNNNMYAAITAHPSKDATWQLLERGYVKPEDIRVPMLFVGGWYDIYPDGLIAAYQNVSQRGGEKARAGSRLLVGPWIHGADTARTGTLEFPAAEKYAIGKARLWFDHCLRGVANEFAKPEPRVTYYQMGDDQWKTAAQWPPASTGTRYYLTAKGALAAARPSKKADPAEFRFDPANPVPTVGGRILDTEVPRGPADQREKVESRAATTKDMLLYTSPALSAPLSIAGKVSVELFVSSDRPDTDFTALLTDVYPDGRSIVVAEGIRRMRFRESNAAEKMMKPGEVYSIAIDLMNTAITFPKGHQLRLVVSSSNYPKYSINHNDGGPMYEKRAGQVATNRVYFDPQRPSALVLPVVRP